MFIVFQQCLLFHNLKKYPVLVLVGSGTGSGIVGFVPSTCLPRNLPCLVGDALEELGEYKCDTVMSVEDVGFKNTEGAIDYTQVQCWVW